MRKTGETGSSLTAAIPSIADGMASGVLAGVYPLFGPYGLLFGTPIAALFTSPAFMGVVTTSAMGIAQVSQVPLDRGGEARYNSVRGWL